MIRRNVELADGTPGWMLISQIEHARISGQLAAACRLEFLFGHDQGADTRSVAAIEAVAEEVRAAVAHHDDGWEDWERRPRLDPKLGRPVSFTELEAAEAVDIWSRSVAKAETIGPLAAWAVAGHFMRLLDHAVHLCSDSAAVGWQRSMNQQREEWLAAWSAVEPAIRTPELAERVLQWVWTFDEVSLWFCCDGPPGEAGPSPPLRPFRAGHGTVLEMQLWEEVPEPADLSNSGLAEARPWRFNPIAIDVVAEGIEVPRAVYSDWPALLAASQPGQLRWRFAPAEPVNLDG